jgi:hypothetical protein
MKPCRGLLGLGALALVAATATQADAAWNNVFQVTCHRPRVAGYVAPVLTNSAPGCCDPCAPPVCTTQYVQRCYYQPVTVMQTKTYYEPVTTYRTSYYYEPVCSYRYSCYYDPCTCSYQQVAQPVTSYQLRSRCCPVQSWVQRCCSVPVTVLQKSCCWEPQTTCSSCSPCSTGAVPVQPMQPVMPAPANPPKVTQDYYQPGGTLRPPVIENPQPLNPQFKQQFYPPNPEPPLGPGGTSHKQPVPNAVPPTVKIDRIVSVTDAGVLGQVVSASNAPRAGAQVVFVNASQQGQLETVTANAAGQFQVALAPGGYLVYVHDAQGQPVYHSRIDVDGKQPTVVKLTSR